MTILEASAPACCRIAASSAWEIPNMPSKKVASGLASAFS